MIDRVRSSAPLTRGRRASAAKRPLTTQGPAAAAAPELPEVLQFMRLLWAVDHGLQRTSKRMLRGIGVTGPQRLALRLIGQFPSISAGDLATLLHVHPSTLTGILTRLLEQQLIVRAVDTRDARRSVLRLSARGTRLDALRAGTVEAAVSAVLRRASAFDRRCVAGLLRQLAEALTPSVGGAPGYPDRPRSQGTSPVSPRAPRRKTART
jgi:MarR family transcriptional regulator, organic hydroperoxide resistance regulator